MIEVDTSAILATIQDESEIVPFDQFLAVGALDAFSRYGKGINPNAKLNLGDCASYALAKSMDAPLLFKGNDFSATDLVSARV